MRGTGYENVLATNIAVTKDLIAANKSMSKKPRMCWKCQKDKSTVGGHIKMFAGGPMKFICKECMDKKKEKVDDTREKS